MFILFARLSVILLVVTALLFSPVWHGRLYAQDVSQMGISSLQLISNDLVNKGQFEEAIPLLEELVSRIESSDDTTIKLDLPIFILGVAYIQQYINSKNGDQLETALIWFDRLESEYPESPKLKDALLKKVDLLLILDKRDEAIELIQQLIENELSSELSKKEAIDLTVKLTRIYYSDEEWEKGLPIFKRLLEVADEPEDRAWGAAACFEAYSNLGQYDNLMTILPSLAYESEIRYLYRLNVAMLQTSDRLVNVERFTDAVILLNLIKTNDVIINYHKESIAKKKAQIELITGLGRETEETETLKQEIAIHEQTLDQLKDLPTLRTDLLLRRARNYNVTDRAYESFWMFYDLMKENPEDKEIEFFTYAAYAGALALKKYATSVEIGKAYRDQFPEGKHYSIITLSLVNTLKDQNISDEYVQIAKDFIDTYPNKKASSELLAVWSGYMIQNDRIEEIVIQVNRWFEIYAEPTFKDGLFYWLGMAKLQLGEYADAVYNFSQVLERYPESVYSEDSLMRMAIAYFYDSKFDEAKQAFYKYTEVYPYPKGYAIDQAFYFLGELEKISKNYELALQHLQKADELTQKQAVHDSCAFSIGEIYEQQKRYDKMVETFTNYLNRFSNTSKATDAIYQLGRGYEFLSKPSEMLDLYRNYIERYASDPNNTGVDTLIEGFAEKYQTNKTLLTETVAFLDRLENDSAFRTQIVTDRGFLFEYFFNNKKVDQYLYNRLRMHPEFNEQLVGDLSPIDDLTSIYRQQLAIYPTETPVEFFKKQLTKFKRQGDRLGATRMLMGLYRSDIVVQPEKPYDKTFLEDKTPRLILYIADYSRTDNIQFAVEGWNTLIRQYPRDDAAIVAYMRLADLSAQRNDFNQAIDYLDKIREYFPGTSKLPAIVLRQGELYTQKGDTEKAREEYKYILSVPAWRGILHAQALFQIGESYMAEKEYGTAHGYFERTFVGYSHFGKWAASAYLEDAKALIALGSKEDAINTLTEALEVLPQDAPDELMQSIRDQLSQLTS